MTLPESPKPLKHIATAKLPTPFAEFTVHAFKSGDGKEHLAMVLGDLSGSMKSDPPSDKPSPLVRVHSECMRVRTAGGEETSPRHRATCSSPDTGSLNPCIW